MTYTQLRSNIIAWIIEGVDDPTIVVVRANQSTPRPDLPYISVNITAVNAIGSPDYSLSDVTGEQSILHNLSISVSIQGYGYTAIDALQKIRHYAAQQAGEESMNAKDLVFMSDTGIRETSITIDITVEERFLYEMMLSTRDIVTENVSYIGTVDIADDIKQPI